MQANEVRLGNYVLIGAEITKVENINESGINFESDGGYYVGEVNTEYSGYFNHWGNAFTNKLISPIPLTEEWLKRFGFVKNNVTGYTIDEKFISFNQFNHPLLDGTFEFLIEDGELDYFVTSICGNGTDDISVLKKPIEYIHQLQNVIFALTGEELQG